MRSNKRDIWMNGRFLETVKNQETAEMMVRRYQRQDLYEVKTAGYKNNLPVYEIRDHK